MSIRSRLAMGFVGLAMVAPAARAGDPDDGTATATAVESAAPDALVAPSAPGAHAAPVGAVAKHTHKGLFGWRHCTECQRARIKSRDGVDIPAPPSLDPGVVTGGMAAAAQGAPCPTCQGGRVMAPGDPHPPGIAAVGGDPSTPGFAVVNEMPGAEPTPVGMAAARPHGFSGVNMAGTGPRPATGAYDPLVAPASVPPAQDVMSAPAHERPRVLGHLFGIPKLGMIRRDYEDKERSRHAAISYGQSNKPVTELPASVVYSNGSH